MTPCTHGPDKVCFRPDCSTLWANNEPTPNSRWARLVVWLDEQRTVGPTGFYLAAVACVLLLGWGLWIHSGRTIALAALAMLMLGRLHD